MSCARDKLFSVKNEVAVHPEISQETVQAESLPEPVSGEGKTAEEMYYSSAVFEPGSSLKPSEQYMEAFQNGTANHSAFFCLLTTLCCGIAGGLIAIPIIFIHGNVSWFILLMLAVIGPFTEETLKQSGMIFQLEKLPRTIRSGWQFFLSGTLGGLVFGALENVLYQYVYLHKLPADRLAGIMAFRWTVCMFLHVSCTWVSAFGLKKVWQDSRKRGIPSQIADAFPWFALAMGIHGVYNLAAYLFFDQYFKI